MPLRLPSPRFGIALIVSATLAVGISPLVKAVTPTAATPKADAVTMQRAITAFLISPNAETHQAAKSAWTEARQSYLQTEAFRFYEGPIDFIDPETGEEGPEGRINAWPMNEAFIEYVQG